MSGADAIADDEIILKRISPGNDKVKPKGASTQRATSYAIGPRPGEEYPSWSRQSITSAERLLEIVEATGRNMAGWSVTCVRARDVRNLGLDVAWTPTEDDPGHCEIVPTNEQPFTPKIWSTLAKYTEIVHTVDAR